MRREALIGLPLAEFPRCTEFGRGGTAAAVASPDAHKTFDIAAVSLVLRLFVFDFLSSFVPV